MMLTRLYLALAQLSGYIGVGIVLGALLRDGNSSTPYWIAGILVFLAAVLIGMSISSRDASGNPSKKQSTEPPEDTSTQSETEE